jgi:hypothetical protein
VDCGGSRCGGCIFPAPVLLKIEATTVRNDPVSGAPAVVYSCGGLPDDVSLSHCPAEDTGVGGTFNTHVALVNLILGFNHACRAY